MHSLYVMPTLYSPYYCTSRTVIILTPLGTQILIFQTQSAKVRSVHLCSSSVLFTGSEDGRITRLVAVSVYLCIYVYVSGCVAIIHSDLHTLLPSLIKPTFLINFITFYPNFSLYLTIDGISPAIKVIATYRWIWLKISYLSSCQLDLRGT